MPVVAVARHAMNTRFEVLLHGARPVALRAAADQALDEIERLEAQLSLFRPTSEIAAVNRRAALEPVRVSPPVFRLLHRAQMLSSQTEGAFDPTVAPLMHAWGFLDRPGAPAPADALAVARDRVGMHQVELDDARFTVRFKRTGMMLDLGAIGKGYAIDCAADVLREAGIEHAFLHGGTSSCYALGTAEDGSLWRVAINEPGPAGQPGRSQSALAGESRRINPNDVASNAQVSPTREFPPARLPAPLATVALREASLGVSAIGTRTVTAGDRTHGHVMDPRSGRPVQAALLAAAVLPSATDTDALSTALIILGADGLPLLHQLCPHGKFLVLDESASSAGHRLHQVGFE